MVERLFVKAKRIAEWPTDTKKLCKIVANFEVNEFFVSEEIAARYIRSRIYLNRKIHFKNPYKQKLYEALYERVMDLWTLEKNKDKLIPEMVALAQNTKAPCIGITPRNIYMILITRKRLRKCTDSI